MIRDCREFLVKSASEWGAGSGHDWSFVLHNNYHPHCSNVNLLWFRDADPFPRIVTKVFHDAELPGREFRNQSHAWSKAPKCVPKPLHFGAFGGRFWAVWMEGVPGFPFRPGQSGGAPDLVSMVDTIASLHTGVSQADAAPDRYARMVIEPLRTLAAFGASPAVRGGCEQTLAAFPAGSLNGLPPVPQHGDLFVNNMLLHDRRWYILDWETFGKVDLPFYDVLTLVFSWLRAGGETPSEWNEPLRRHVPDLMRRYARALDIAPWRVRALLPLILANWFHMQWADGRTEFTRLMYRSIANYFEHRDLWEATFVPAGVDA